MFKNFRLVMAWCLLAGASLSFAVVANEQAQPKKEKKGLPETKEAIDQSNFMRKKLAATNTILEGLSIEDTDLVVSGAKSLLELSASEKFQVKNDVMYRQFNNEFQRSAKGLLEAAEKGNFDAAALKWIDTTMRCLECHRFVRGVRLAVQAN